MAAQIRANMHIRGFQHTEIHEKLMLYMVDTMLFLGDTEKSLSEAMSLIRRFGVYSGLVINWSKSYLMLLDVDPDSGIQVFRGYRSHAASSIWEYRSLQSPGTLSRLTYPP